MAIIAICYDFDGTLCPLNMQEYDFIPKRLGMSPQAFWKEAKQNAKEHNMDEVLAYMELMLEKSKQKNIIFDKSILKEGGKKIKFFQGVQGWFGRINKYGQKFGIEIHHYIISSGLTKFIQGSKIAEEFKYIFACDFKYDSNDIAIWPSVAINYTNKTQYLFRINKGILNSWDNQKINKVLSQDKRAIPFSNIIYIGDGETDVPAMQMTEYKGGYSIALFDKNKQDSLKKCQELIKHKRCSLLAEANYTQGSSLDILIKTLISKIACEIKINNIRQRYIKHIAK